MWPRLAWIGLSFAIWPAAKWAWNKILEQPSYTEEIEKINDKKTDLIEKEVERRVAEVLSNREKLKDTWYECYGPTDTNKRS
jgi:hypothetical protein